MNTNFWNKLSKPIYALAPMADVTDAAFRKMFAKYGKPTVLWTEFVSVDGLLSAGKERLLADLEFDKKEHPIVAQIFGSDPENFEKVGKIIKELGFDGIDINMGCPQPNIEKLGAGSAHIKKPELAVEIIKATKRGSCGLPVSVKTRIGYKTNEIETWLPMLLKEDLAALTVHFRTRNEMSKVPAHWEFAKRVVELRDQYAPSTKLIGNGDVVSIEQANRLIEDSGVDGVMIGRGAFGRPWLFSNFEPSLVERLGILVEHTELFEKLYKSNLKKEQGKIKNFEVMKKHFKAYCNGFDGAKELRMQLMETSGAGEVRAIVDQFLSKNNLG